MAKVTKYIPKWIVVIGGKEYHPAKEGEVHQFLPKMKSEQLQELLDGGYIEEFTYADSADEQINNDGNGQKKLSEMTVPELRSLATEMDVTIPNNAIKEQIIALLENAGAK